MRDCGLTHKNKVSATDNMGNGSKLMEREDEVGWDTEEMIRVKEIDPRIYSNCGIEKGNSIETSTQQVQKSITEMMDRDKGGGRGNGSRDTSPLGLRR